MRKFATLALGLLSAPAAASGVDPYFICSRMEAPENRLACYDAEARRQQSPPPTQAAEDERPIAVGDWVVNRGRDRMTDRPITVFMLSTALAATDGGRSRRALFVRCNEAGLEVYFNAAGYLGTGRGIPVRFRLDDRQPVSQSWAASTRGDSAFASDPRGFVRSITGGARTLLIEATGYNGERFRAEFALSGVERLAAEMNSCPMPGRRR